MTKKIVRALILALFLASALIVTISTRTEAIHLSTLSLSASCSVGKTWFGFGSKTKAKGQVYYYHSKMIDSIIGPHWHSFSYAAYARVADEEDRDPQDGDYGNQSVSSWTRYYSPQKVAHAEVKGHERYENDAYASSSASEDGNSDNWDFCPK